jgi:hypothetical protein
MHALVVELGVEVLVAAGGGAIGRVVSAQRHGGKERVNIPPTELVNVNIPQSV